MRKEEMFVQIVKENEGILYRISRAYTNDEDDQKDLYQEIVYQLWKGFDGFRGEAKVSTWIYRIALNTALFHSKKAKRKGQRIALEGLNLTQEHYDPVLEERLALLYKHVQSLNDIDKGIILLFLEGKKHEEIASITGFSTTNVGSRIARIKEKLRSRIIKA